MGSKIKSGAILSYISVMINIIAGLMYTPWMVRQIGNNNYGIYNLAVSFIGYFMIDFGLGGAIAKYIAQYRAKNDKESINNLIGLIAKLYFCMSGIVGIVLFIILCFINQIFVSLSIDELNTFRNVFICLGLYSIIAVPMMPLNGIISAYEYFWQLKTFDIANRLLTITLVVIALIGNMGIYALVMANIGVGLLIGISKLIFINRHCDTHIRWKYFDKKITKDIFTFSIWMTIGMTAYQLVIGLDSTILGIRSGTIEIAVFSVGMTIYAYSNNFAAALNGLFLPKVTRTLYEIDSKEQINKLMYKVGKIQLVIIGAIYFGFLTFGQEFMLVWMGETYAKSYFVTLLIVLPNLIISTQAIASTMVTAVNKVKYQAIAALAGAGISLGLGFVLSKSLGAIGVAIASAIGMMLSYGLIMNILYVKVFHLNIKDFFVKCHVRYIIVVILPVVVGRLTYHFVGFYSWRNLAIRILMFTAIYLVCLLLYFDAEEQKAIFGQISGITTKLKRKKD